MWGMVKKQLGARVDEEVLQLASKRAADRNLSVGDYLTQLVLDDAHGLRERAMAAAARFIGEYGVFFDEAEAVQAPGSSASTTAHAA
jgi:hypothetical protein